MATQLNQSDSASIETTDTYKISVLSKIWWSLYFIGSISIIILFVYFLLFIVDLSNVWIAVIFMLPMAVALGVVAFFSITHLTMRLTTSNSTIYCNDVFRSRQIAFHHVKGFRVISTAQRSDIGLPGWEVEIESIDGVVITVPKSIENQERLITFLTSRFEKLDENK
jgi:hypothetical protein